MVRIGAQICVGQYENEADVVVALLEYLGLEANKENVYKVQATYKTLTALGQMGAIQHKEFM